MSDMRLIDANALMKNIGKIPQLRGITYGRMKKAVEETPTIDAVQVVHAKWDWGQSGWYCTSCGKRPLVEAVAFAKYCHRCGAKMDGDADGCGSA